MLKQYIKFDVFFDYLLNGTATVNYMLDNSGTWSDDISIDLDAVDGFITERINLSVGTKGETIKYKISGSDGWNLKKIDTYYLEETEHHEY